jgi:copper chaperone
MKTIKLNVSGMTCNHCVMHVGNALKELDGVADVRVDLAGKSADVTFDESKVDKSKMAEAVKEAGYSVQD